MCGMLYERDWVLPGNSGDVPGLSKPSRWQHREDREGGGLVR